MKVTNKERDLVLRIADGQHEIMQSIFFLRILCEDSIHLDYIDSMAWLVKKRITGQRFKEFLAIEHKGSIINMASYIRKCIFNDTKKRKIYAKQIKELENGIKRSL